MKGDLDGCRVGSYVKEELSKEFFVYITICKANTTKKLAKMALTLLSINHIYVRKGEKLMNVKID